MHTDETEDVLMELARAIARYCSERRERFEKVKHCCAHEVYQAYEHGQAALVQHRTLPNAGDGVGPERFNYCAAEGMKRVGVWWVEVGCAEKYLSKVLEELAK